MNSFPGSDLACQSQKVSNELIATYYSSVSSFTIINKVLLGSAYPKEMAIEYV